MESDQPESCVLAVDLGGTQVRVARVARDGRILSQGAAGTRADAGPEAIVRQIVELAGDSASPVPLSVGVAAPGPLDPHTGIVFDTPNLSGWRNFPLRDAISEAFGLPAFVQNDANLAAYGEAVVGAGRGSDIVIYLTVSTGVGGGIVRGGRIETGANGLAGELGHVIVKAGGPRCNFGHAGCLEGLASGTAIARAARARVQAGEASSLSKLSTDFSALDVAVAAREGDRLSASVLKDAATILGLAIGGFVNTFDPDIVIIGGGVSRSWDLIAEDVSRAIGEIMMAPLQRRVKIVPAACGANAGLIGAGLWAWRNESEDSVPTP